LLEFSAGDFDLGGVDDDDVIAGIDVGGVDRLVLAHEPRGDFRGEAAEDFVGGVDDEPASVDMSDFGDGGCAAGLAMRRMGLAGAAVVMTTCP